MALIYKAAFFVFLWVEVNIPVLLLKYLITAVKNVPYGKLTVPILKLLVSALQSYYCSGLIYFVFSQF
jgi:hypothetical protein